MTRVATPLLIDDLSSFARNLKQALTAHHSARAELPGHVELQNLIARSAGYRNLQTLKAKLSAPTAVAPALPTAQPALPTLAPALPMSDNARRTLMQFDAQGRLVRWPTKFTVQGLAMWILWTRFDAKRVYTESEVNTILRAANAFGDHATLRRELVNHRLLTRKSDCSEYRKLPARPDDEVRAMLNAWRAGTGPRARPVDAGEPKKAPSASAWRREAAQARGVAVVTAAPPRRNSVA